MTHCWIWDKAKNTNGYGHLWDKETKRFLHAHRVYYEKLVGEIPEGHVVCHTCDNPSCVNPSHLFLGTHKDNMQDARKKGRLSCVDTKSAKLTWDQVDEIRSRYAQYETQTSLAKKFGVSISLIYHILHDERKVTTKLTQKQIDESRALYWCNVQREKDRQFGRC